MCLRKEQFDNHMLFTTSRVCLLWLIVLLHGCGKTGMSFQGNWTAHKTIDSTRKHVLRLSFSGKNKMTVDARIILSDQHSPSGEQEYPGAICQYNYQASEMRDNEAILTLSMTSKRIEGVERINDTDKSPRTWRYRVKSDHQMEITTETMTYELHKANDLPP